MKVSKLVFVTAVTLFSSSVFAQNTHMGVPAKDMVVLKVFCSSIASNYCNDVPITKPQVFLKRV